MTKWEYALSSIAWLVVGFAVRLVVERVRGWWKKRQGGELSPVGATTFIGTLFILLTIVQFLLTYSARLHADAIQHCQDKINQNNVAVANTRTDLQTQLNAKINEVVKAKAVYDAQFQGLILHPIDPNNKLAIKKATNQLSRALGVVIAAEQSEANAFREAKAFVREHPAVPITVCTGDVAPTIPEPSGHASR